MKSGGLLRSSVLVIGLTAIAACSTNANDTPEPTQKPAAVSGDPLLYEIDTYFEGLEEWVLLHKGSDGIWCRRSSGRIQDCEDVKREDKTAYLAKFGVMTKKMAAQILAADPDRTFKSVIWLPIAEVPGLRSSDPAVRARAIEAMRASVGRLKLQWKSFIEERGGVVPPLVDDTVPMMFATASARLFKVLAWTPGIQSLDLYESGAGKSGYSATGLTDGVSYSHTDQFNGVGMYGAGLKVGILSPFGGCGLMATHEALAHAAVTEYAPPVSCSTSAQCPCNPGGNAACVAGKCVDTHETQVASVISVGRSGTEQYGASQASLYHWNLDADAIACDPVHIQAAYAWFLANDVTIVNESYFCDLGSVDGIVQDYYSRVYNMTVVRAAGNQATLVRIMPVPIR